VRGVLEDWRLRLERVVAARPGADPAHDIGHLRRVWGLALRIAGRDRPEADRLVLLAASYLHDLVNVPKDSPERHLASRRSAAEAVGILNRLGFPPDRLEAVRHAIEAHSFSAGIAPESPEAEILRDADRLDALGAIGLARLFAISGVMGRRILDPDDPFARMRPLDDVAFALDHVRTKLERLPGSMCTPTGKALAARRWAFVRRYLDRLRTELEEAREERR